MRTVTTHYINGAFVPSHGQEVFDLVSPVDRTVIGQVTLGDEIDARAAIAAAKDAFKTYAKSTLEERGAILQRLHDAVAARTEDHIEAMAIEYGAGRLRSEATVGRAVQAFANVRGLLGRLPLEQTYGRFASPAGRWAWRR
jgi:aldehyde dehydrogenase (NAD+)